jgi:SAM-dependent methyltransferase
MGESKKETFLHYLRRHPEWKRPQSKKFYLQLVKDCGEYEYPWKSQFEGQTAEMIFTEQLSKHINKDSYVLDVGCGHGKFTSQWSPVAKEVVGIDITEGFIDTANRNYSGGNIRYLVVDANGALPFTSNYFDIIYTKKGPWLYSEASRIAKPGAVVIGLYPGRTDGGLREPFPNLYDPLPYNPFDLEYVMNMWRFKDSNGLIDFRIQVIEEIEYLLAPEDILIKRCFGQNEIIKELVWKACLKDVERVFHKNATSKGLKVINYYHLVTSRAVEKGDKVYE